MVVISNGRASEDGRALEDVIRALSKKESLNPEPKPRAVREELRGPEPGELEGERMRL